MLKNLKKDMRLRASRQKAQVLRRFFKTGKGQYGEGDEFLGLTVPESRTIAKKYQDLPVHDVEKLLTSKIHEERLIALLLLVHAYHRGTLADRAAVYRFYLSHTRWVNNWDLVDLSAEKIVGPFLEHKNKSVLYKLARSHNVWERRIAILSTFHYIKQKDPSETLRIARMLMTDDHDLIHKAVGWMLREAGKRCGGKHLTKFLDQYAKTMPRTMLRYAIERLPKHQKTYYLHPS